MEFYIFMDFIKVKDLNTNEEKLIYVGDYSQYENISFKEFKTQFVNITNENNITSNIKNKFKNKEYTHILVIGRKEVKDTIRDLVDNYEATLVTIDTMETLTDEQRKNNDNYLSIMNDFITNIANITLK